MLRIVAIILLLILLILEKRENSRLYEKVTQVTKSYNELLTMYQNDVGNCSSLHVPIVTNQDVRYVNTTHTKVESKLELICSDILKCKDPKLITTAYKVAKKHDIDPYLFISLIYTESTFDKLAVAPSKKYYGLGQIPIEIYDPTFNLEISAILFKNHLKLANNDVQLAIANYKGYRNLSETNAKERVNKVMRIALLIKSNVNSNM